MSFKSNYPEESSQLDHETRTKKCVSGNAYHDEQEIVGSKHHHDGHENNYTDKEINGSSNNYSNGYGKIEADSQKTPQIQIAICGLAMRLPGGIRDTDALWDVLLTGRDMRAPIPPQRFNIHGFDDRLGKKGAIKSEYGYYIDEDLSCLDTSFFSLGQTEVERSDPQQRQLLEVTRECLENAGEVDYQGKLIGCYVGTFGEDWLQKNAKETQHSGSYIMTGQGDLMIANRVSYEYDFQGPSMVMKTGCSASLVAFHEACRALQSGDCDSAIVAGTNLIMGPTTTVAMTQEGILSPDSSCKTFDAAADGFARAEAVNAVYVKRLDDAIRAKNPIRAIVRGTGTNSDGRSHGLMTPNGKSHEKLMRKVYAEAGLDPEETGYVECHGTGTATGDPIEATAVGNIFGRKGVFIGSVKPNVGHSEGASGITSLIKAILALERRTIPPNIKFVSPNPKIPFEDKHLTVPTRVTAWPEDRAERISINSFGIGGTNAHVILDSVAEMHLGLIHPMEHHQEQIPKLLLFSARSQHSLQRQIDEYHRYTQSNPLKVSDLAYTLSLRREHLPHRAFSITVDGAITSTSSLLKVPRITPRLVLVFNGQGSQWPGMGRGLMEFPSFRQDIAKMDSVLRSLEHPPVWSIENELQKTDVTSQIHHAELAQPLCTALQIALVNLLTSNGIRPKAVIGHSSGEIAAAYASDAISLSDAIIVAYYRGYVTKEYRSKGAMAAIGLDFESVSAYLRSGVTIACENSPSSITISGDLEKLEDVIAIIKRERPDVSVRRLEVDIAYHSHHMEDLSGRYRSLVEHELVERKLSRQSLKIPMFSCVTAGVINQGSVLTAAYWASNLTSPVLFNSAVKSLLHQHRDNIFVEIGPHATLSGPLRQICAAMDCPYLYVPTLLRGGRCIDNILSTYGQLYTTNIAMDLQPLMSNGNVLTDLPNYPWDHTASYWYETRVSKDWRFQNYGHHGLLGVRVHETTGIEPCWRNILHVEDEPWLCDHKIREDIVFPLAGYLAMAGEAIMQVSGIRDAQSFRHVIAHTALVLTDSKPVELVTTLRSRRLNNSTDSEWFEFTISSLSGSSWMKNCEGLVKSSQDIPSDLSSSRVATPRKVLSARWYKIMSDIGIVYGPEFQGLSQIESSTTDHLATGEITDTPKHPGRPFLFHPTAIDACLQLYLVALAKGIGRNFVRLLVPTMIEELQISCSAPKMNATAWSHGKKNNGVHCTANAETVLWLSGVHLTPLDEEKLPGSSDRHAGARLEWHPHFDFLDKTLMFDPPVSIPEETEMQEEMALLCMIDSAKRLKDLVPAQDFFEKFRAWLDREIHRAEMGTYPVIKSSVNFTRVSSSLRQQMIRERYRKLSKMSSKRAVATGIMRIWENCEETFTGKADTLDILMKDDILTEIYNAVSVGHGKFVQSLSHAKPTLRILEVGAGTGGTTEMILRTLIGVEGHSAYSIYTYTDISAGFFPQAKERFAYASNVEYKVFDISHSYSDQGFEASSYDIILAPNVIHATPFLQTTLQNLRPLLRPKGHLVLTELCAVVRAPNYIFGNFSGWWLGEKDGRPDEPYISVDRWDRELKEAGFTGVDSATYDAEEPYQYCAAIVTQPQVSHDQRSQKRKVSFLCDRPHEGISERLIAALELSDFDIDICKLQDSPPEEQPVISTLDLESYFFEDITEDRFLAFQNLLRRHKSQSLLWLTRPAQVLCKDPRAGHTIGMARTIRSELAIPFFTLEIDQSEAAFAQLVMQVFAKILESEDEEQLSQDREYIVDEGIIKTGRYQPFSLQEELNAKKDSKSANIKTLTITKPGMLDSLSWQEILQPSSLEGGEVEITAQAIGLNFRDIVYAMGILLPESNSILLGLEMSGTVSRVGSNVHHLAVGDRVFALAPHGCIGTKVVLPAPLCVQIPDSLGFEEAATMPICFATAIQALVKVGGLRKDETVLVHSACGGVGHAAIQVCNMIGAEIFATVGSPHKAQYLVDTFGIPRRHIFNSRDTSFYPHLMHETHGRGVDLVLNSLSGELLHTSWRCVAEFGKLVELGKRDLAGFGRLDLEAFLANRSYCCVDVAHLLQKKPKEMGELLMECLELYVKGHIHPISPVKSFEASEVEQGFRYLQKGDHIGKVIIEMPTDSSTLPSSPYKSGVTFDTEAAYLLTGGLGGLGRCLAVWMVERGARALVFLSPHAGLKDTDSDFIEELRSLNCSVLAIEGKVQDKHDVERAISSVSKPIKGVLHLAMTLRDAPITDMTHTDWISAIEPKVEGTWNLHNAFLGHSLDFFFLASSLVTVVDQPGQGNYNAANTFLEAFCQYRQSIGLPASVLNICPIDAVGFVAENPAARRNMKAQGLYFLGEQELLDFFELSVLNSHPTRLVQSKGKASVSWKNNSQILMGLRSELSLDDPNNRTNWRRDRRMGVYHNRERTTTVEAPKSNTLGTFLAHAAEDPNVLNTASSAVLLAHEIGRQMFSFMLKPEEDFDISLTLSQVGLDSLMAIELRRWWKQAFGLQISVLEIMAAGTLEELGKVAAQSLMMKMQTEVDKIK